MGIKQTFYCDIDESEDDVLHLSFFLFGMSKPRELDVCASCRENLPLTKIIDNEIGESIRASQAAFPVSRKNRQQHTTSSNQIEALQESARREIICEKCGELVHGGQGYAAHWRTNHDEEPYPGFGPYHCPEQGCGRRLPTGKSLVTHLNKDHDISARRENITEVHRKAIATPVS